MTALWTRSRGLVPDRLAVSIQGRCDPHGARGGARTRTPEGKGF